MRDFKVRSALACRVPVVPSGLWNLLNLAFSLHEPSKSMLTLLQRMQTDPPAGVSASPIADNVMTWFVERLPPICYPASTFPSSTCFSVIVPSRVATTTSLSPLLSVLTSRCFRNAVIIGPADTPFEDGTFRLVMHFEEQYPNKPPGVKFISTMFHPNVYATGELCLDILQNRWSPTYDVAAILTSIQR